MNKPLRRIAIFCGLLMVALMVRANWLQFAQADDLQNDKHNRRVAIDRYAQPRGDIIVDGKAVTGSKKTEGTDFKYKRTYKDGEIWAPVTGYASQAFGATQLEGIHDGILTGDDDRLFFNQTIDMLTGEDQKGGNVVTTLDADVQKAGFEAMGDKKGAAVAINPETGAILGLVSTPSYDPSSFAGSSSKDAEKWNALLDDEDKPLLNRALRETYPPGSTFKVVTAAAALESGLYESIDEKTDSPDPYQLPGTRTDMVNDGDHPCENASLRVAMQWSCNTVFAKISHEVTNEKMIEYSEKFGFGQEHFVPVRTAESVYPEDIDSQNAMAGIGQASNRATPLQMAMVAATVANDGRMMEPYMMDQLIAPSLSVVEEHKPREMGQAVSGETAQQLQRMMETVVEEGTGTPAQIDGVTVGGKTGTAQHGENNEKNPYAWFISYAKTSDDSTPVAVAVIVESADVLRDDIAGSKLAAPVAKAMMEAALDGSR
ncbi:penicillin-binding protein 2 [Streptomyces sp. CNQ085]|uniref:peptidoglycan D,D-transpeptidase FtsI family protein n=1 Tax=Streptomyces sp. CNQ085 TaxID=2886944 RepID=UPI001F511C80|nr:penicillin-binding transpeptidase domain-containing protein [Streptomyces sp. CNQ085]MCI0383543.1 penicillin-binding protein 2 [Streptomyces sp. CNQ085]